MRLREIAGNHEIQEREMDEPNGYEAPKVEEIEADGPLDTSPGVAQSNV